MSQNEPLTVNGWKLFSHPLMTEQVAQLASQVEKLKHKDPLNYKYKNATKLLAAIHKLIYEVIPRDPTAKTYRLGKTLGKEHSHWFRAKFFQQYRLFFRYHLAAKIIVYVWVNDESTKRAYESKNDAYSVFDRMLRNGNPPDDWESLIDSIKDG